MLLNSYIFFCVDKQQNNATDFYFNFLLFSAVLFEKVNHTIFSPNLSFR